MKANFNLKGAQRKNLIKAISEILNEKAEYQGVPSYAYRIGEYTVDRKGTLTGPEMFGLLTALAERGFQPETATEPEPETVTAEEPAITAESDTAQVEESDSGTSTADDTPPADNPAEDVLTIEVPFAGFAPEKAEDDIPEPADSVNVFSSEKEEGTHAFADSTFPTETETDVPEPADSISFSSSETESDVPEPTGAGASSDDTVYGSFTDN